jgi:hypothetical protein
MNLPAPEDSSSNRFYIALAAGAGVVILLVVVAILLSRGSAEKTASGQPAPLPFGAAEQAYAAQIRFSNLQLSQATNMLNQEFTYVVGTVANTGNRSVKAIEIAVEFHDLINQLVLRETARVFAPGAPPLAAGREREFQLTFEHVPAAWNHQPPSIRVTGLDLQ